MRFDSVKVDYAEPKHHQVEGEEGKSEEDIAVVLWSRGKVSEEGKLLG